MSAGPGQREVAHRIFAAEFDDATYTYTESDEDRAPNYVVTPTGARVNRVFIVGVLTETEWVNEETIRARVVDPTGPFVLYASQYQPDARGALDSAEPPAFLAVTGKANTFRPDGADRVYSSIRPEAVAIVDAATRDRWAISTAELTIARLGRLAEAMQTGETADRGIEIARREYDVTPGYASSLFERCIDVLELVADEIETVPDRTIEPTMTDDPTRPLSEISSIATQLGSTGDEPIVREDTASGSPDTAEQIEDPPDEVLSADEREEIEASYGTDFTTGDEIESTTTADENAVEETSPDPDESPSDDGNVESEAEVELDKDDLPESAVEEDEPTSTEAPTEDPRSDAATDAPAEATIDESTADELAELTVDSLVELMRELADGDGVSRAELVEAGADTFGEEKETVAAILQDALLAGRCYESGDDVIRPI